MTSMALPTGSATLSNLNSTKNLTNTTNVIHFEEEGEYTPFIVFIFGSIGVGAIFRMLLQKWSTIIKQWKWGSFFKLPYTVFLMLFGMLLAALGSASPKYILPYLITEINPELFFQVFLPVVIFESAYVIDTHVFWRSISLVTLLAVPGLLLSTGLTAILSLLIPEIINFSNPTGRVYICLMFGAILSATDPVAVVAILKELALSTIGLILQQTLLGPIIGWIAATLEGLILQQIYNDALAEITLTLSFTYLTFHVGELCNTSGVLAVVALGIALDRSSITPEVDHFLHRFWEMLAYLANTLIFVIVGSIITTFLHQYSVREFGQLILLYIGVTLARAISIFAFFPWIKRLGLDLTWKHTVVMIWSGLRGAVGLALAVYLNSFAKKLHTEVLLSSGPEVADGMNFVAVFSKILRHTAGIVLLTLIINATTVEAVLKRMGMLAISGAQQVTMLNAVNRIQSHVQKIINVLKYDRFLADAKWKVVEDMTLVDYPYRDLPKTNSKLFNDSTLALHIDNSLDFNYQDLLDESRLRMVKAMKMSFNRQYIRGLLGDQEAKVLILAADRAMQLPEEFIDIKSIERTWNVGSTLPAVKRRLERWIYGRRAKKLNPPSSEKRHVIFDMVLSDKFEIVMQCIILLNTVPIALDFSVNTSWSNFLQWTTALKITNFIFVAIYTVELMLRLTGLGFKQFISNGWIQFDIIILLTSYVEIVLDQVLLPSSTAATGFRSSVGNITKLLRVLRALRLLRLSKTVLPRVVNYINVRINQHLSFGYNVAKGLITAEEEVSKLVETICENYKIQAKLHRTSHRYRLEVLKRMSHLQRDQPGVAISVKTRNAITTLLNNSRDAIKQLFTGGILDETEIKLLERGIAIKLKRLARFPPYISPLEPNDVVEDVVWVKDNPEVLEFVKSRGVWRRYDSKEVIITDSQPFEGIHIIVHGVVKITSTVHGSMWQTILDANMKRFEGLKKVEIAEQLKEEDILGTGEVIGYVSLLTDGDKQSTVTTETAVQTFFLSVTDMEVAFMLFPDLRRTLWKVAALPIATQLCMDSYDFQSNMEFIQQCLSQGNIIQLDENNPTFTFNEGIGEAYLVHGLVRSDVTEEVFVSPYLILPDHPQVQLHWSNIAVLLVIPRNTKLSYLSGGGKPGRKQSTRSRVGSFVLSSEQSKKLPSIRSRKVAPLVETSAENSLKVAPIEKSADKLSPEYDSR